jgi:type IV pilus assembly protein PilY1
MAMNKRDLFRKTVAWSLIAAMVNPATIVPAFARDTDIYLLVTGGTTTAEPNVLFILGTNDRMNIAEPWREYPGAYDSHAEYLWNDINIISNSEVVAESASAISDAAPPVNPFSPWGTWDGANLTGRQALWNAVKTYANATQSGDPGPRYIFRNYFNDFSWLYWLPAGTATTDLRLSAVSFNRFRAGPSNYTSGTRGGVVFPPTAPTSPYNYSTVNSGFAALNLCSQTNAATTSPLIPSTIMAPTSAPANAGVWLNQQWIRWNPYLNLATVGNSGYPGSSTVSNTYYQGYLDSSFQPPTNGFIVPPVAAGSYSGPPYRDSVNNTTAVSTGATGLPIRIQRTAVTSPTAPPDGTHSYAGWEDLKADFGGYTHQQIVYNNGVGATGYPYSCTVTGTGCTLAGTYAVLQTVLGWYGVTTQVGGSWPFTAWKGNRDGSPAFGSETGTSAYYDTTNACNPATGGAVAGTCISISQGGTSAQNATWTLPCGYTPGFRETDAGGTLRSSGGTCSKRPAGATASCSDPRTSAPNNCSDFAAPTTCPVPTTQASFITKSIQSNCSASGTSSLTVGTCTWSGRSSVLIEGQGYYYYGGTCTESSDAVITGGASRSCSISGVTTRLLNNVSRDYVYGPITTAQFNGGTFANTGCGNATAAATYTYGGSCGGGSKFTVNNASTKTAQPAAAPNPNTTRTTTNPLTTCAFSGGTALTIRGNAQTYNRTCATSESNVDQTCATRYGAACDNSTSNVTSGFPLNNTAVCANATTSIVAIPSTSASTYFYQAYKQNASTTNLYHECIADGPAGGNPSSSYPTNHMRTFTTAANTNTTGTVNTSLTQAYTTGGAASRVAADSSKNIDVYSVNYLNWLYGAKACRNTSGNLVTSGPIPGTATCSPIARKTRLQVAKDALSALVLSTDGVRLGLMVYNKTDTNTMDEGGNIAFAIRRMGTDASDTPAYNNRQSLVSAIQGVVASSRTPLTEALYEAYLYFSGRTPVFGTLTTTAQVGGQVSAQRETTQGTNVDPPNPYGSVFVRAPGGNYNSPMLNNPTVAHPAACQKSFVVMITNGQAEEDYSANSLIKTPMAWTNTALGFVVSPVTSADTNQPHGTSYDQIPVSGTGPPIGPTDLSGTSNDGGYIWLDELAYFMANADVSPGATNVSTDTGSDTALPGRQSVVTYTIGFAGISAPVVQNAAQVSGGMYYIAQNAQQLQAALTAAFVAIRDWNPTSASATVPISALNRAESSTDVYLAFFGPSPTQAWQGTTKKYQLGQGVAACGGTDNNALCLTGQTVLANGTKNIETTQVDPVSGLQTTVIDPTAVSGPNANGTAWMPNTVQDGNKPNAGGTGWDLLHTTGYTPDTRKVYTFITGASTSTDLTDSSNAAKATNSLVTKTLLGNPAMSDATRETLINFVRGGATGDTNCTDGDTGTACTTWAAWPHFDVQHSKPAIVTYDTTQNPPVQYLFYVQNNGMLTAADANTGQEKWSFLIEEAYQQIAALAANNNGAQIDIADGSPAIFFDDQNGDGIVNGSDRVWLYFGQRRGGRAMYALDITAKDAPIFKWKIRATGGSGKVCTGAGACVDVAAFDELGQTWSTPAVGRIRNLGIGNNPPAVIFGGGYDPAEDTMPPGARTMGRAVYVINGDTADVIQSWGNGQGGSFLASSGAMSYAIPSDVTPLNTDLDAEGYIDRLYVGDLGGDLWRFDIDAADPSQWRGKQLASLSDATGEKRKFFFAPAAAKQNNPVRYDAVYIGSGDKEHPVCNTQSPNPCAQLAATDQIFMVMDRDTGLTAGNSAPLQLGDLVAVPNSCTGSCVDVGQLVSSYQGWARSLDTGEKVTNSPTVFFGRLRFGTYTPLAQINSCTPPGQGRLNEINALNGDLFTLNSGAMSASQRYYSSFLTRGYISTGQVLIVGKQVYHVVVSDAQLMSQLIGTLGSATKIYWYLEPEQ